MIDEMWIDNVIEVKRSYSGAAVAASRKFLRSVFFVVFLWLSTFVVDSFYIVVCGMKRGFWLFCFQHRPQFFFAALAVEVFKIRAAIDCCGRLAWRHDGSQPSVQPGLFTVAVYVHRASAYRSTAAARSWTLDCLPSVSPQCLFTSLPRLSCGAFASFCSRAFARGKRCVRRQHHTE